MNKNIELGKWARLLAALGIIFGMLYLVVGNIPTSTPASSGVLNGLKADLLWPSLILLAAASVTGILGFVLKDTGK